MKNLNCDPRNNERADSARLFQRSTIKKTECRAGNMIRLPVAEKSTVLTKRARGPQVDAVLGAGHPEMPLDHITRRLDRIIRKGVRSATVRELGGVSLVFSPEIPIGTFALRTADQITLFRSESGMRIISVPCGAAMKNSAATEGHIQNQRGV